MREALIFRPIEPGDVAALSSIHQQCFAKNWSEEAFASLIAHGCEGWLAEEEGPQGFILLRAVADEAEIITFAVIPAYRRRGIGRRLAEMALAAAKEKGARRMFLEVEAANTAAAGLYASLRFHRVGIRKAYYSQLDGPASDAHVMEFSIDRAQHS